MSSSQQTAIQVSIHREKKRSKPQGFEGRRLAKIVGIRADADEGKMLTLLSVNMAKVKPLEKIRNRIRHVRPHDLTHATNPGHSHLPLIPPTIFPPYPLPSPRACTQEPRLKQETPTPPLEYDGDEGVTCYRNLLSSYDAISKAISHHHPQTVRVQIKAIMNYVKIVVIFILTSSSVVLGMASASGRSKGAKIHLTTLEVFVDPTIAMGKLYMNSL